jgi:hypothetical protein
MNRRFCAGLTFGIASLGPLALWLAINTLSGHPPSGRRLGGTLLGLGLLPAISAVVSGSTLGALILDRRMTGSYGKALLVSIGVVLLATFSPASPC